MLSGRFLVLAGEHCYKIQVFQLTILFLRGSLEDIPKFTVGLDRVANNHRSVELTIACVQRFVRAPRFTQHDFFPQQCNWYAQFGCHCCGHCLWGVVVWTLSETVAWGAWDNCCRPKVGVWCCFCNAKKSRDISERLFGVCSVETSAVGEPSCRTGVCKSDVVEVGQVEYLYESALALNQPCSSTIVPPRSPGLRECKRSATPVPIVAPKLLFELDVASIILPKRRVFYFHHPKFEVALSSQNRTARFEVVVFVVLRLFSLT